MRRPVARVPSSTRTRVHAPMPARSTTRAAMVARSVSSSHDARTSATVCVARRSSSASGRRPFARCQCAGQSRTSPSMCPTSPYTGCAAGARESSASMCSGSGTSSQGPRSRSWRW
jgi:hypothetical protein